MSRLSRNLLSPFYQPTLIHQARQIGSRRQPFLCNWCHMQEPSYHFRDYGAFSLILFGSLAILQPLGAAAPLFGDFRLFNATTQQCIVRSTTVCLRNSLSRRDKQPQDKGCPRGFQRDLALVSLASKVQFRFRIQIPRLPAASQILGLSELSLWSRGTSFLHSHGCRLPCSEISDTSRVRCHRALSQYSRSYHQERKTLHFAMTMHMGNWVASLII